MHCLVNVWSQYVAQGCECWGVFCSETNQRLYLTMRVIRLGLGVSGGELVQGADRQSRGVNWFSRIAKVRSKVSSYRVVCRLIMGMQALLQTPQKWTDSESRNGWSKWSQQSPPPSREEPKACTKAISPESCLLTCFRCSKITVNHSLAGFMLL